MPRPRLTHAAQELAAWLGLALAGLACYGVPRALDALFQAAYGPALVHEGR